MSKPTPNYFCVHTGYFRNDRTLALRDRIGDRAFYIMPMLWSWAGENQINGDVSKISVHRYRQIFRGCQLDLTVRETKKIVKAINEVGFVQCGKLHSWDRFNRQFTEFDRRQTIKRDAAFARWRQKVETVDTFPATNGVPQPESAQGPKARSVSQEIWLIDQALKTAKGKAKKDLLAKRERILSEHHGVDVSAPAPAAAASKPSRGGKSPGELRADRLMMAQQKLQNTPDMLSESNVEDLARAGVELPDAVRKKFSKIIEQIEANPVPE